MPPVQEMDPDCGACTFRRFFEVTPDSLFKQRRLYNNVALPLYPGEAHRAVSLIHITRAMGAQPHRVDDLAIWRRPHEALSKAPSVMLRSFKSVGSLRRGSSKWFTRPLSEHTGFPGARSPDANEGSV